MTKVTGSISQKGVAGSIVQKGVAGSIVQKGVAGSIVESGISGQEYCDESLAFFAKMDLQPPLELMVLINVLFESLISYDYWDKIKIGYLLNLHTEQASLLNIKGDDDFNMIAYNSPVHQAYKGFKGDAVAAFLRGVGNFGLNVLGLDVENFSILGYSKEWLYGGYIFGTGNNSQGAYILGGISYNIHVQAFVSDKTLTVGGVVGGDEYLAIQRNSATNKQLISGANYGDYAVNVFRDVDASGFSASRPYDILAGFGVESASWQGGNFVCEAFSEADHLVLRSLFNDFKNDVYNLI